MTVPLCSFCLQPKSQTRRLVAGPGVMICGECAASVVSMLASDRDQVAPSIDSDRVADWTDEDVLGRLPEAAQVSQQVEETLKTWVETARERKISWERIGTTLGMTRQSAWERFATSADSGR